MKAMGAQAQKKEVLKPGAMVVSGNQEGNWGSYARAAVSTGYGQVGGMNQPMQMGSMNQPMQMGSMNQPMQMAQGYGQPQYPAAGTANVTGSMNGQMQPQGQQYGYPQNFAQPQAAHGYAFGNMQS